MEVLLHPTYLPNIEHFLAVAKSDALIFETWDNFQKQTYRNRAFIYGANGKLLLNIPVIHSQKNRQFYRDVEIAYYTNWQLIHKKSIESAYRTSPFFEFYEDELLPLYAKKEKYLFDFNLKSIEILCEMLQIELNYSESKTYEPVRTDLKDLRYLVDAKRKNENQFEKYSQVFEEKHGFLNNLSVLDLICNSGPNSLEYLLKQKLSNF